MYSSQSNSEKAVEKRPNPITCYTVFSIFFVNWDPHKCDGASVSGCKAEPRSRWHMIDSEAFKRVFYALVIMLRERESSLSVALHRTRPRTSQATELSFPVPPTMRHHARSRISEVQLKLSSGRSRRGRARTALAAERPAHGESM